MLTAYQGTKTAATAISGRDTGYAAVQEKRHHERYYLQVSVLFHFDDGADCAGISRDVSLAGFFVNIPHHPSLREGMSGTGTILLGRERYTVPCRVTRQNHAGIGVAIEKESAVLGYAITMHIVNEITAQHLV